jgi:hypothetical protein
MCKRDENGKSWNEEDWFESHPAPGHIRVIPLTRDETQRMFADSGFAGNPVIAQQNRG